MIPFEEGVQLIAPSRTNVIVRDDDLIQLDHDGLVPGSFLSQQMTVQQALDLIKLVASGIQAALTTP